MGSTSYSTDNRSYRSDKMGYKSKSRDETFTQSKERKVHESMDSRKITLRECRDSETHPKTIPIILNLDVTGSMLDIPHELIKEGLPTLMGTLIQNGATDASLLFTAIGDHEADRYPLQIGQFESGDAELDMWLTRTYLESGGGGNAGESYSLAWYFAANHVQTDAFDKRNTKGFLFTVGDEPCLPNIPKSAINEIMPGNTAQGTLNSLDLLRQAQTKFNVYHLHIIHSNGAVNSLPKWKEMLGENCIEVSDYKDLPKIISKIILSSQQIPQPEATQENNAPSSTTSEVNML